MSLRVRTSAWGHTYIHACMQALPPHSRTADAGKEARGIIGYHSSIPPLFSSLVIASLLFPLSRLSRLRTPLLRLVLPRKPHTPLEQLHRLLRAAPGLLLLAVDPRRGGREPDRYCEQRVEGSAGVVLVWCACACLCVCVCVCARTRHGAVRCGGENRVSAVHWVRRKI
jgi:hypothetical protein